MIAPAMKSTTEFNSQIVLPNEGEAFYDDPALANLLQCSRRTIWLMAKRGDLPKPVKIGGALTRWRASDLRRVLLPKPAEDGVQP